MPPVSDTASSSLSNKGQHFAAHAARADMALFMEAAANLYHPKDNAEGTFPLNVAENGPMIPFIQARLSGILRQSPPDWVFQYTDPLGHPDVRATVAAFMEKFLCQTTVHPDQLAFSAGASAIIEVSAFLLANPGEVVAIPAPSYPMYTHDLGAKAGLERYDLQTHVELADHGPVGPVTPARMDEALAEIAAQGKKLKILLLTAPDNPTGCMYPAARLRALAGWCIAHEVHLVVNEIYGLSTLPGQVPADTISFAQIMAEKESPFLHLWYALSKDFAMSGLRFGIVHSRNEAFMAAYGNANIPHMVSNLTQWVVGELMQDEAFLTSYIAQNQQALRRSYETVTQTLDSLGAPYLPASGSLFVWADLSRFLDETGDEHQLWLDIFHHSGVLLTPGAGFQHQKKGLFRIVHTALPADHLQVAMDRMAAYLQSR
ncbi:MAG: aminotransferase class I/II-fold pyridoxal phosphate-dependent enzyme [Bacteroidetes bacterium]|nr:MAG: aminotransferase class I/II-fold pyridoxal phosphate-dependent enzyme [Bacteroidota bacterium]